MTPTTMDKIVNIALHPTTSEEEATAAFRKLHRDASKFGGLSSVLGGGEADLRQRLTRAQNEAAELREQLSSVNERFIKLELEHEDTVFQMQRNREDADDAEVKCRQQRERVATLEAELANLEANGGGDELGIIARRNKEIEALAIKVKVLTEKAAEADDYRERYASERASQARQEVERKVRAALSEEAADPQTTAASADGPQPEPAAKARQKSAGTKRAASTKAQAPRARAFHPKRKGADIERLLFDLLTFDWKSVSTLFNAAQRLGFKGTEGALRFAAERLTQAGNAEQGLNSEGRIAFRRA